jgi:hypothetical protein
METQFLVGMLVGAIVVVAGLFLLTGLGVRVFRRVTASVPASSAPTSTSTAPTGPGPQLRLLALLQREGRLLDFLLEDIKGYTDAQIGASVRDIHQKCQKAIKEHLTLVPVLAKSEGDAVEVAAGFDPSAIRLTGKVGGQPPFKGTLQHPGWKVQSVKLAAPPAGQDELIVQPAEVELS